MFAWDLLNLLWLLVAAFFAGFGWALGAWLCARLLAGR